MEIETQLNQCRQALGSDLEGDSDPVSPQGELYKSRLI